MKVDKVKVDSDWDEESMDEVMDLDDAGVPDLVESISSSDLDYEFLPKDEGEGFVEELERRIDDRIAMIDEDEAAAEILDEVFDDEDYYDDGEVWSEDEWNEVHNQ